jgi:hypothetical protein
MIFSDHCQNLLIFSNQMEAAEYSHSLDNSSYIWLVIFFV